eukprot:Hpha_TRINITY_DN14120_c0_g1::TRINITY_DN14120_c0_g1_i1::g.10873::m.10873
MGESQESGCQETIKHYGDIFFLASGYAVCSALLVVINKWALVWFPFGATLTAIQFGSAALTVRLLGAVGIVEVDPLEYGKVMAFLPAVVLFYISIASNLKLLEHANVDTFIVVRSCTPLATLCVDIVVSKVPVPSAKSFATLILIIFGAIGYVYTDEGVKWNAYAWSLLYLVAMTVDQVFIKKVVMNVKLTRWGIVYYNNVIAACMMPVGSLATGEASRLRDQWASGAIWKLTQQEAMLPVVVSCAFGIGISYFGLNARKALTATAFTVLGVVCKFGTVLINTLVWSRHAPPSAIGCVCVCILGGILYQQVEKEKVLTPTPKDDHKEPPSKNIESAGAGGTAAKTSASVRSSSRGGGDSPSRGH